jgi:hypothetical protein
VHGDCESSAVPPKLNIIGMRLRSGRETRHQRCGDLAIEMRVAPGLVVECVENRERRRTFLDSKLGDSARFSVDQLRRPYAPSSVISMSKSLVHSLRSAMSG